MPPEIEMPSIEQILSDPCASDWLKTALRTALQRDCCNAVNDAELLLGVLSARFALLTSILRPTV